MDDPGAPSGEAGGVEEERLFIERRFSKVRPSREPDVSSAADNPVRMSAGRGVFDLSVGCCLESEVYKSMRSRDAAIPFPGLGGIVESWKAGRASLEPKGLVDKRLFAFGLAMNNSPASEEKSINDSGVGGTGDSGVLETEKDLDRDPGWLGLVCFGEIGFVFDSRVDMLLLLKDNVSSTVLPWLRRMCDEERSETACDPDPTSDSDRACWAARLAARSVSPGPVLFLLPDFFPIPATPATRPLMELLSSEVVPR